MRIFLGVFLLFCFFFLSVYCIDEEPRLLDTNSAEVTRMAKFAISEMNTIMSQDHPLTLVRVVSATITMQNHDHTMYVLGLEYEVDGYQEQKKVTLKEVNNVLSFEEWGGGC